MTAWTRLARASLFGWVLAVGLLAACAGQVRAICGAYDLFFGCMPYSEPPTCGPPGSMCSGTPTPGNDYQCCCTNVSPAGCCRYTCTQLTCSGKLACPIGYETNWGTFYQGTDWWCGGASGTCQIRI